MSVCGKEKGNEIEKEKELTAHYVYLLPLSISVT